MNDFTKKELEYLSHCVSQYLKYGYTSEELSHMRIKIESMIENYCKHELEYDSSQCMICKKCGHLQSC